MVREATGADAGDTVTLAIEPTKEWPEPEVPADLKNALAGAPRAHALWMDTTPNALGLDSLDRLNQTTGNA
ncbi:MAG: hypothetical protein ABSF63_00535 [Candidatus Bathyarchaeia archaeon]|jgi:hypothetical protein